MNWIKRRWYWIAIPICLVGILTVTALVPYMRLARRIDRQLEAGPFVRTFSFYSAPETVSVGDQISPEDLVASLKRCGYRNIESSKDWLIAPGTGTEPIRLQFSKGSVASISGLTTHAKLQQYAIPPQLIANVSDEGREKRILIHYSDLPPVLVQAIVSAEDKRFFQHAGFDPYRIAKAAYVDFKEKRKEQGASTITMQLARNLYLDRDKRWKRKLTELLISVHLERKLTKQQLLEYYCNQVYLGGRGTFSINGFGEASRAFFSKETHKLDLAEAALLAGLIQRPSYFNPLRYPGRAVERRNLVLRMMRENGYITAAEYSAACSEPLNLRPAKNELSDSQYYLDLAGDDAQKRLQDREWRGVAKVYTTLDLRLQRAAEDAIRDGMRKVDKEIRLRHGLKPGQAAPQVALIALDPHTGEIRALCGGRSYSTSQLNRALAERPPGSVFKPFVYAAALNTAVDGSAKVMTPASLVLDSPTIFKYANQTYSPDNFEHQFHGEVTFRQALAKSMNVAAVRVAEMAGYDRVVELARRAGMNEDIQPTPAVALGAYAVTPLEVAGAYTIFANGGVRERPFLIDSIRQKDGAAIYQADSGARRVLDPRIAFLMVDMLQEVMRSGTAAGVRSAGFKLPAAGKTGTSHDGWFAGFTSGLLCVVWVGFDDYRELNLEGSRSALPIWAQFMTEAAAQSKRYRDVKQFTPPAGVIKVAVDPISGGLATPFCPWTDYSYFVSGTQPTASCSMHNQDSLPITVLENVSAQVQDR